MIGRRSIAIAILAKVYAMTLDVFFKNCCSKRWYNAAAKDKLRRIT